MSEDDSRLPQPHRVENDDDAKPDYHGHRARLRGRFLTLGPESLADYELLEILLTSALPRKDTKPLARALLAEFGSFAGVIAATPEAVQRVSGCGPVVAATLKTVHAAAIRFMQPQEVDRDELGSWQSVLNYCRVSMGYEAVEQLRLLFLDRKNRLIADEVQHRGTIDQTPAYPREVVRRALELHAVALIIVHNHPSGDATPSRADIDMTAAIASALQTMGISLHDHLIITRSEHCSLRGMGLIPG